MDVRAIVAFTLIGLGIFWLFVGGVGLLRFPDFYTRLHPAGKADTFGAALAILGLIVYEGATLLSVKLVLIQLFILLANPAVAHALGRAAHKSGLPVWTGEGSDAEEGES